jgi:hypothetical protein
MLIHKIKDGKAPFWKDDKPAPYFWNTLFARSHVVAEGEPDKIRAVFGATWLLLQAELMFIWPLQHTYMNFPDKGKFFWGREIMRGGWKKIFREVHLHGLPNTTITADWKQFDKRLLFELIDDTHSIWRSYFDFSEYEPTNFYPWGHNKMDPTRITRLWEWMCHSIKHTPTLLPDGRLFRWNYLGFGSGYQQTQLQDTFSNAIMLATCLLDLGVDISSKNFWIMLQGDDSLVTFMERMFSLYGSNFAHMLAASAKKRFNAILSTNPAKTKISDRLNGQSVLGYFNKYGIPFRTDEDLLSHLIFPERLPQSYPKLMGSVLGLAMASCGCSERFYDLCHYVYKKLEARGYTPNMAGLEWLEKTGNVDQFSTFEKGYFPTFNQLTANNYQPHYRTDFEDQRTWPTRPTNTNRFHFLLV